MDLGTGSGAIGLSLAFELAERGIHASVICVDESTDALTVAKRNALKHRLLSVSFVHSSWYDGLDTSLEGQFDLIVANPPYVGEDEFVTLDPILLHEPKTAIVAEEAEGTEGFSDLAVIISNAPRWLTPSGALLCEHANIHRNAVIAAATAAGFADAQDFDDLAGKPRMLVARR
jgi:release factor glutamine methyltransferase